MEWEAIDVLDPIGERRADFRNAHLISTITNIVGKLYTKKGTPFEPTKPDDFMPTYYKGDDGEPQQSVDDMKNLLMGIVQSSKVSEQRQKVLDRKPIAIRKAEEEARKANEEK